MEATTAGMDDVEKLVIIVTHGPDEPELATLPFVMATGALVSEMFVFMAFQGEGVRLITKGGADGVQAEAFPPLVELIATIGEFGGLLAPCSPCLENRGLTEDDLLDGVEVIGAARLVSEIASASATLNY
jgi:predicted peroxiredoxin